MSKNKQNIIPQASVNDDADNNWQTNDVSNDIRDTQNDSLQQELSKLAINMKQTLEEYEAYIKYSDPYYKEKQLSLRSGARNRFLFRRFFKYAAIFLLPLIATSVGVYYIYNSDSRKPVLPGKELAIFTLSNGEVMEVDSKVAKVHKKNGEELVVPKVDIYHYMEQTNDFSVANYSTIMVPHGGFFNVVLSDGTKIYLNSKSKMKFPFKFTGKERKVWLEGEAYFEVARDSIPFIVATENQNITVLGTTFNVSAYPEDSFVTTALLSGKVSVQNFLKDSIIHLEPGECATYNKSKWEFTKYKDDTHLYVLWKDGIFKFRDARLEDIVKVLKRWYRFDVEYESDDMKDIRFNVIALKENPLDEVFGLLQSTTTFKYSRDGNRFKLYK